MPRAVFLSYASQDSGTARRIADALGAAGVEVWFDQEALRGGDVWDQKIRRQIKECALFMPVISANTQSRAEGYFRLEWKLAVDRSHLMADDAPFLFPVVVDGTTDAEARVPDRFREVQWTRIRIDETPAELAKRVSRMLAGEAVEGRRDAMPRSGETDVDRSLGGRRARRREQKPAWLRMSWSVLILVLIGYYGLRPLWRRSDQAGERPGSLAPSPQPMTEARSLVERSREILKNGSLTRDQIDAAEQLCERAMQLDPSDPLVWAEAARVELFYVYPYGYDRSDERRRKARDLATRAANLAPDDIQVRIVQANVFAHAVGTPALMEEAEKTFRELLASHPSDKDLTLQLAEVLRDRQRFSEAANLFESIGEFEIAGWSYYQAGELRQSLAVLAHARPSVTAQQLRAILEEDANEDLDAAQAAIDQMQPSDLLSEMPAAIGLRIAFLRRDSARLLMLAKGLNRDYLDSNAFTGPLAFYTGMAHELAGRPVQAEVEWRTALAVVEARLKTAPDDRLLLLWSAWLHAALHDPAEAGRLFERSQEIGGLPEETADGANWHVLARLKKSEPLLEGLEAMLRARPPGWEGIHSLARFSPEFDLLRGDPRFEKLLRETKPESAKPFD